MHIDVVSTQYGPVQAVPAKEPGILIFKGIPIGADTSGENRFRAPQPPQPWNEVKICDTWPDRFLQSLANRNPGVFWADEFFYDEEHNPGNSENGLAANVFLPENTGDTPLPVFVFIHGGGFTSGYASELEFNAEKLAAQNVIVVLLQYRLSALGWLAHPELSAEDPHGVSGNWAVRDMVHGLSWIRDNIANFGGDPEKVTISGQSAGAMMVTHLLRSPLARPLFRNAIVQSGFNGFLTGLGGRSPVFRSLAEAEAQTMEKLKEIFGHPMTVAELRAIPSQNWLLPRDNAPVGPDGNPLSLLQEVSLAAGNMTVDGYVFTEESVDLLKPGNLDGVNIMIGGTQDEMTSLSGDTIHRMGLTPESVKVRLDAEYGEGCAELYPTSTMEEAEFSWMRAQSDSCLQKYILSAQMTENNRDHHTFVYYLRQVPPSRNPEFRGAYHSADLWYMFNSIHEGAAHRDWTESDYRMADIMSTYWMNFVKYSNPTGESSCTSHENPLKVWEPCDSAHGFAFMELGNADSRMVTATPCPQRDAHHRNYLLKKLSGHNS